VDLAEARALLAAEWEAYFAVNPSEPHQITRFYEQACHLAEDLQAWHATPERQQWTQLLVQAARQAGVGTVVDIGAGCGHDLLALRAENPAAWLVGVEPNNVLRRELRNRDIETAADARDAPIQTADLLVCVDVLEHVPDPEAFLAGVAQRAPVGCWLFETTATHDQGTPLHLPQNRGWHPGRCLETHGWELADQYGRVRLWQRAGEQGTPRASLLLCAYRSVSLPTLVSIVGLAGASDQGGWRLRVKGGDALIARSRSILLTDWWRSTADTVALFVDDDIAFRPQDAERLVQLCRDGLDIVCGAYPVRDGEHLACRLRPGTRDVTFGPGAAPLEIAYAATGFMAVSRRVVDALVKDLPLCWAHEAPFYPLFVPHTVQRLGDGAHEMLSEDWNFSAVARKAGFGVWLDPQTVLEHRADVPVTVRTMALLHEALKGEGEGGHHALALA
jgi:hypothetical protein